MNNKIKFYTSDFEGNSPIDSSLFDYQLEKLEFRLPKEYIDFMRQMNGGEGAIGENGYLMLWQIEDIIKNNEDYQINLIAPGFFAFGKDAADTAYAFEKKTFKIYEFGFMADIETDPVKFCASTFDDFLEYLYQS